MYISRYSVLEGVFDHFKTEEVTPTPNFNFLYQATRSIQILSQNNAHSKQHEEDCVKSSFHTRIGVGESKF